jgi:hypothetical protein
LGGNKGAGRGKEGVAAWVGMERVTKPGKGL